MTSRSARSGWKAWRSWRAAPPPGRGPPWRRARRRSRRARGKSHSAKLRTTETVKTTTAKLDARLEAMTKRELEHFARGVVWSLYARWYSIDEKGMDEELDALGLNDEQEYLDS